jgi:uncharacterized protein YfaS (alpha-2-macroglobulin family)
VRRLFLAVFSLCLLCWGAPAWADGLNVDSNFIDTSNQNPTLCVHFTEALKPGLDAHYEDYVQVDHFTGIVAAVSGNNLCLGGMPYQKHYSVTLRAGLPAQNGDTLASQAVVTFSPGDRPPLVAIAGDGLYLAKRSAAGLAITSVNIKKLSIHVLRLNDLNAIQDFAASQNNYLFDPTQQSIGGYSLTSMIAGQVGVIWSGSMAVDDRPDVAVRTLFPIATAIGQSSDRMAAKPGVYLVVAEDAANAAPAGLWTGTLSSNDQSVAGSQSFSIHWVIVTDLGLTALSGDDGLHIGVRAVSSAATVPGVRLDLVSQGGDVLTSVTSDAAGNAVIPKAMTDGRLANAPLAIAAYGPDGDFSYLPLDRAAFDLSDRGVTGRAAPSTNDAFIFAERGIYRPGETVHAVVLLRDADGKAMPGQKISLGLVRADTVQVATVTAVTDEAGGAVVPIQLPRNALHGQWTIQASIDPALPPIGQLAIDVENFQPADLRVDATGAPAFASAGTKLNLQAVGNYLYGAPAAGLPVRSKIIITTDDAPVAGVTGYSFGLLDDTPADLSTDISSDDTDAQGRITVQTAVPAFPATTQPMRARVSIGLLEPSGNVVAAEQVIKLTTTPDLVGIKPLFAGGSVNSGAAAAFAIAAFDPVKAKPVAVAGAEFRLVRTDTVYDWVGDNGSWTWKSYSVDHPVELGKLDLAASGPVNFSRSLPDGNYTLIVADPKTGAASSVAFSVGWSGLGTAAATPDTLTLTSDQHVLAPGGTATVKISGPFAGLADVYVANNRVYGMQQIAVPAGGATASVTATADWNGGAYVIADLHRGSADASGHASVRAIGLGWIGLDPAKHTLGVQVQAPVAILPRTQQMITVKISNAAPGQPVHLVLDAVDEGILGLTKYTTPDPAGWFWGQRQLGVEIRDIFGSLLNDQGEAGSIQQGGDEGAGGPRLPMQSTRLFAVATADLTVGADRTVQIPLDVPDFEGQARLTAVAWSLDAAGSGAADMLVRDPVVMMPGLPQFLSAGDVADLPVTLTNISAPAGAYTLAVKVGGLTLASAAPLKFDLGKPGDPKAATILRFPVTAGAPGIAQLELLLTNADGLKIDRSFSFTIRAAHPPARITLFGTIKPGAVIALPARVQTSGAKQGTLRLAATGFPGLDAPLLLGSLAADSDGTDTVSVVASAFPLLDPAMAAAAPGGADKAKATIASAITLIANRQAMSGDIGEWSFSDADGFNDWVTDYALDFLFSAHAAGYDVPQVVLDRSTGWLRSEISSLTQVVVDQGNAYGSEAPAPFPAFTYTQWLLARTGQADIGALRVVADGLAAAQSPDKQPLVFWGGAKTPDHLAAPGDLAKLALALQLAGDSGRAARVLDLAGGAVGTPGQDAWTQSFWWSGNQDAAIVLFAAATMGDSRVFAKAAARLDPATMMQDQDDNAMSWLLRAASALSEKAAASGTVVKIDFGGKTQSLTLPGAVSLNWEEALKGAPVNILAGSGYYALTAQYTPATPEAAFAHGMSLQVSYAGSDGKPVDLHALHQGQEIAVTIAGAVPGKSVNLLSIAALLPACFSIEKAMPGTNLYPNALSAPQNYSSDVDRFLATVQLGQMAWESSDDSNSDSGDAAVLPPGHFAVAYLAKVTTAGTFTLPEVTVRDRLHPAISASSGSQTVTVLP